MDTELKGPFRALIKKYIMDKSIVIFKLANNEMITGKIIWSDKDSVYIEDETNKKITIMLDYIVMFYLKD